MPRHGTSQGPRNGGNTIWNNQNNDGGRISGNSNNNNNKYYDHDERSERQQNVKDNRRRVSFKPSGAGPSGRLAVANRHTAELAIRTRLAEDEDMGGAGTSDAMGDRVNGGRGSKGKPRINRRGSPIPRSGHGPPGKKKLVAGTIGWFLVTIPFGHKHDRQTIFKQLHTLVHPLVFIPHYFKVELTAITFYVDDIQVAEVLLNADRQLTMPDGYKMLIKVRNSIPHVTVDATVREKMKLAMAKRYTAATKALDLTKFHADPDLGEVFCALFRPTIMMAALEVIAENIPDLEALKLDDNKIHLLDHLKCLPTKLPFLKILHLANNKITTTHSLDVLKECTIIDLVLDGNPVKDRARDPEAYISDIRRKFPKLQRLDNVDLPPQIGFDLTDETILPPAKASFLCNMAGADIVRQFLEQYFIIFDSENRQPLLNAYHEHAMFSMTAGYTNQQHLRLAEYMPFNRNILRNRDAESRNKLLKTGRLRVVSFLSELPDSQHDPLSFAVDLTLFTPQLIMLTVTGVFKEKPKTGSPILRSFQKALTIVPSGSGFCIKNELMHINNCTMVQVRAAFKPPAAAAVPAPSAAIAAPVAAAVGVNGAAPDEMTKHRMIQSMAQHSKMNLEWSRKCLEETNWDFDRAGYTFTELHKQNKIPPEAFAQ